MGLLGKALKGAVKGSFFFAQHGGAETFYAAINKASQAASQAILSAAEKANQNTEEQNENN